MSKLLQRLAKVGRVVEVAWFREPTGKTLDAKDPPLSMLIPIVVLALATIYFGINTEASAGVAQKVAAFLIGGLK